MSKDKNSDPMPEPTYHRRSERMFRRSRAAEMRRRRDEIRDTRLNKFIYTVGAMGTMIALALIYWVGTRGM